MKKQKAIILIIIFNFLFGCSNFSPLYGGDRGNDRLSNIQIDKFKCMDCGHKVEYEALQSLRDFLGYNGKKEKPYSLDVKIKKKNISLAFKSNSVATRSKIFVELEYIAKSKGDNTVIAKNTLTNIETIPVLKSTFSNALAEEEMTSDMIKVLIESLKLELLESVTLLPK